MGNARSEKALRIYPRRSDITRAVQAARSVGVNVTAIDVSADGTIRLGNASSSAEAKVETAFDRWNAEGKL
jgi:hypothetical protein